MLMVSILVYAVALYLVFKYIRNELLEVALLIGISIVCKLIVKEGSFYPLFAMPMLLALRHNKPYSIVYTAIMVTIVNITYGFGVWSIGQYIIYGIISVGTYFARNILNKQNKLVVFIYSFVSMFIFGMLMDIFAFYTGNFLEYNNVFEQVVAGLPFDIKYGLSGIAYGGVSLVMAYMSSVDIKDILKVGNMKLEKTY